MKGSNVTFPARKKEKKDKEKNKRALGAQFFLYHKPVYESIIFHPHNPDIIREKVIGELEC